MSNELNIKYGFARKGTHDVVDTEEHEVPSFGFTITEEAVVDTITGRDDDEKLSYSGVTLPVGFSDFFPIKKFQLTSGKAILYKVE